MVTGWPCATVAFIAGAVMADVILRDGDDVDDTVRHIGGEVDGVGTRRLAGRVERRALGLAPLEAVEEELDLRDAALAGSGDGDRLALRDRRVHRGRRDGRR